MSKIFFFLTQKKLRWKYKLKEPHLHILKSLGDVSHHSKKFKLFSFNFNYYKKSPFYFNNDFQKNQSLLNLEKQKSYRYHRLISKLPVRGQRTHTNARTRKKRNVV